MAKRRKKPLTIPTRYTAATGKELKKISIKTDVPVSALIRRAVSEFITRQAAAPIDAA